MKSIINKMLFVIVLSIIAIYSNTISIEILENYNNCVNFMANNTVGNNLVLGI